MSAASERNIIEVTKDNQSYSFLVQDVRDIKINEKEIVTNDEKYLNKEIIPLLLKEEDFTITQHVRKEFTLLKGEMQIKLHAKNVEEAIRETKALL